MPIYDPYSTKSFKEQISASLRLDRDVDEAGRARLHKARARFAVFVLLVVCVGFVLAGDWIAMVAIACFAIPSGAYAAWVLTAPVDQHPPDARR